MALLEGLVYRQGDLSKGVPQYAFHSPEESVVSFVILHGPLRTQTQVEISARRRPREVEGARVQQLPDLQDSLLIGGEVTQRDESRRGDAEDV